MNKLQYQLEVARTNVLLAESSVREAKVKRDQLYLIGQAKIEQSRAQAEMEYNTAKEILSRQEFRLSAERAYLQKCQLDMDNGFESTK